MTKKELAGKVCDILNNEYGTDLRCYLEYDHKKPWQLLVATILSAQCTDERVSMTIRSHGSCLWQPSFRHSAPMNELI